MLLLVLSEEDPIRDFVVWRAAAAGFCELLCYCLMEQINAEGRRRAAGCCCSDLERGKGEIDGERVEDGCAFFLPIRKKKREEMRSCKFASRAPKN